MSALVVRIAASRAELAAHMDVRRRVFCEEQGLFGETDEDVWDQGALHAVALRNDRVVGAVRFYALDEFGLWKGDRLAVTPEARPARVGAHLVRFAVRTAGALGGRTMMARIQAPNVVFFQRLGWEVAGPPALHRGLPHQRMTIGLADGPVAPPPDQLAWALG